VIGKTTQEASQDTTQKDPVCINDITTATASPGGGVLELVLDDQLKGRSPSIDEERISLGWGVSALCFLDTDGQVTGRTRDLCMGDLDPI